MLAVGQRFRMRFTALRKYGHHFKASPDLISVGDSLKVGEAFEKLQK
jgi:hypothetical protein